MTTAVCPVCGSAADTFRAQEALAQTHTADSLPTNLSLNLGGPPLVPDSIVAGRYRVIEEIGRGAVAVVYVAGQLGLNRLVALKVVRAGRHAGDADLTRFRIEAEALARLRHPSIVQVFEIGEHEGFPFLVLEYFAGGSLDRRLANGPLAPADAAALIEALARGVHHAHLCGIIHRDLKPGNVVLAEDGSPRLTDFGLVRRPADAPGLTLDGAVLGTPSYLAPEQARGQHHLAGPTLDVYGLGAIFYECLTGRPPFKAASAVDTLFQVVHDDPVPPRELRAEVPVELEATCLKCLRKDPTGRYPSAAELADDLRRYLDGDAPSSVQPAGLLDRLWGWARRPRRSQPDPTPAPTNGTPAPRDSAGEQLAAARRQSLHAEGELEQLARAIQQDLRHALEKIRGRALEQGEAARSLIEETERMRGMLDGLTAYAKVGRAREDLLADSAAACDEALGSLRDVILPTGAAVTRDPLPLVKADPAQLVWLFKELIGNGLKFGRLEGAAVHVSARPREGGWQFGVRDNGIGIAPADADRVFGLLQRLHPTEDYPGNGVGLAVCKKIVERHGGRIWVESLPGEGSTIHFTLASG